jgi:hypothetical protein
MQHYVLSRWQDLLYAQPIGRYALLQRSPLTKPPPPRPR